MGRKRRRRRRPEEERLLSLGNQHESDQSVWQQELNRLSLVFPDLTPNEMFAVIPLCTAVATLVDTPET